MQTDDGNALQILYGKAIIRGGLWQGNIYSISGDIEVHGCVEFDGESITGTLLDGNKFNVAFVGQPNDVQIVYNETVCVDAAPSEADDSSNLPSSGAVGNNNIFILIQMMAASVGLLTILA